MNRGALHTDRCGANNDWLNQHSTHDLRFPGPNTTHMHKLRSTTQASHHHRSPARVAHHLVHLINHLLTAAAGTVTTTMSSGAGLTSRWRGRAQSSFRNRRRCRLNLLESNANVRHY